MVFTFFFRDAYILEFAVKHVVPFATRRRRVRIGDAGCVMAPEPYSLAIMGAESMVCHAFRDLAIHAAGVDESGTFGGIIRSVIYGEDEVRTITGGLLEKHVVPNCTPGYFQAIDTIREGVVFQKRNLLSFQSAGSDFALIACNNVFLRSRHLLEQDAHDCQIFKKVEADK